MNERILYYWLAKEGHTGKVKHDQLIKKYGSLRDAFYALKRGEFVNEGGLTRKYLERLAFFAEEGILESEIKRLDNAGISMACLTDAEYPAKLKEIYAAPVCLFYRGRLPGQDEPLIAIVGARACTEKGRALAEKTAYELCEAGVNVVSGLAVGTDTAAHKGALRSHNGATYGILACGVDRCYPACNNGLFVEMMGRGGVISEFVPGTAPLRVNFPQRNRIISGLSDGILVTEARVHSGSLITADMGLDQGKNIYAFPGDANDPLSAGTNRLIQLGAKLVRGTEDILEEIDLGLKTRLIEQPLNKLTLESREKIVYDTLCLVPRHISDIMKETDMPEEELFHILLVLELKGYVCRTSFEYYIAEPEHWYGQS